MWRIMGWAERMAEMMSVTVTREATCSLRLLLCQRVAGSHSCTGALWSHCLRTSGGPFLTSCMSCLKTLKKRWTQTRTFTLDLDLDLDLLPLIRDGQVQRQRRGHFLGLQKVKGRTTL